MAKYGRKTMQLDTSGLKHLLEALDELGRDIKPTAEYALKHAAVTIQNQTTLALNNKDLPAGGKYSTGETARSVIHFPKVEWEGDIASVPVGFDFEEPGAGGFLISGRREIAGTPRMKPDEKLRSIYKGKRFMNRIQKQMWEDVLKVLEEEWNKAK